MRLRDDVSTTDTEDGVVLLDERTGRFWQLNPSGAAVMHAMLQGRTVHDVAAELADRYRLDSARAREDVQRVLDRLRDASLVEESR